jgi:hypothetical protein
LGGTGWGREGGGERLRKLRGPSRSPRPAGLFSGGTSAPGRGCGLPRTIRSETPARRFQVPAAAPTHRVEAPVHHDQVARLPRRQRAGPLQRHHALKHLLGQPLEGGGGVGGGGEGKRGEKVGAYVPTLRVAFAAPPARIANCAAPATPAGQPPPCAPASPAPGSAWTAPRRPAGRPAPGGARPCTCEAGLGGGGG